MGPFDLGVGSRTTLGHGNQAGHKGVVARRFSGKRGF